MAKRHKGFAEATPDRNEALRRDTSLFLQSQMKLLQAEGNLGALIIGDMSNWIIGLPLPCFALEALIQNTVWPLERIVQLVGPQSTCKSGLCFEIARWFRKSHGVANLLEHESKLNPAWARSIVGWDDPYALGHIPCTSVDDWQKKLTWMNDQAKAAMTGTKKKKGTGRTWPLLQIVDSLVSKLTAETQEKIKTQGHGGRGWPAEALSITRFLGALTEQLTFWPFSILGVNHLKPHRDEHTNIIERHKSGGKEIDFMESLELQLDWQPHRYIHKRHLDGMRLYISCYKNAMGVTGRKIPVDCCWWDKVITDPMTGETEPRQVTKWFWHASTIQFLLRLTNDTSLKARAAAAKEIVNLQITKGPLVHSKELGIGRKSPVTFEEAGEILQANPAVLEPLRELFGVRKGKVFTNEVDFRKQKKVQLRKAAMAVQRDLERPYPPARGPETRNDEVVEDVDGEIIEET